MTVLLHDRATPWLIVSVIVVFIVIRIVCDRRKSAGPSICPVDRLGDNREQVKLLFDYTKFHITVYSTLAALLITISSSSVVGRFALSRPWLLGAFGAIILAGLAAGVVAASMPACTAILNFWNHRTGPYDWGWMTIRSWTYVEHTSFWLSVACVIIAFVKGEPSAVSSEITMTIRG